MNKYLYLTPLFLLASLALTAQKPDSSFGTNGNALLYSPSFEPDTYTHGGYIQPGGRILVGATTIEEEGFDYNSTVSAFTPDGHVDSGFGDRGGYTLLQGSNSGAFIAPQSNQKIVAAGVRNLSRDDAFFQIYVERLTNDGKRDSSFGTNSTTTLPTDFELYQQVQCIAVDSSDYIYIGGAFYSTSTGSHYFTILRLTPNGTLDSSFRVRHTDAFGEVCFSLQILPDGSLAAGYLNQSNTTASLIKYKRNGERDSSFGKKGVVALHTYCPSDNFLHTQLLADGSLLTGTGNGTQISFYKVTAAGRPDRTFSGNGVAGTGNVIGYRLNHIFAVDNQNRILLPLTNYTLKRILATGTTDSSFGKNGYVTSTLEDSLPGKYELALSAGNSFFGIGFYTDYTFTQIVASKYKTTTSSQPLYANRVSSAVIADQTAATAIVIYPNPSKSVLTISGLPRQTHLTITDAAGRVLITAKTSDIVYQLPVSTLKTGIYYLRVNNGLQTIPFVKN